MANDPYDLTDIGGIEVPANPQQSTAPRDPYDLTDIGGVPVDDTKLSPMVNGLDAVFGGPNALSQITQNVRQSMPGQVGSGIVDALRNTISAPFGYSLPNSNSGTAYNVGNMVGNTLGFMGGGEVLDAARAGLAAKDIPLVSQVANYLGGNGLAGIARRALGASAFGAATNPNDRLGGAESAAAWSAGVDLPVGALSKFKSLLTPQDMGVTDLHQGIVNSLTNGLTQEQNQQQFAQQLRNTYLQKKGAASDLYNNSVGNLSNSRILDPTQSEGQGLNAANSQYLNLNPNIVKSFNYDTKDLHNNFLANPTFQNAHDLQSQLGFQIRALNNTLVKKGLDPATQNYMQGLQRAQGALQNDMSTYLGANHPEALQGYNNASNYFFNNVVPYRTDPSIAEIANGKVQNPGNLSNLFKDPEPDTQRIISDLGPQAQNQIVYDAIGAPNSLNNPQKLIDNINKLDTQGLGSYVNPQLKQNLQDLQERMGARDAQNAKAQYRNDALTRVGTGVIAGALTHGVGSSLPLDVLSGLVGFGINPSISSPFHQGLSGAVQKIYPYGRSALLGNAIPGGQ